MFILILLIVTYVFRINVINYSGNTDTKIILNFDGRVKTKLKNLAITTKEDLTSPAIIFYLTAKKTINIFIRQLETNPPIFHLAEYNYPNIPKPVISHVVQRETAHAEKSFIISRKQQSG